MERSASAQAHSVQCRSLQKRHVLLHVRCFTVQAGSFTVLGVCGEGHRGAGDVFCIRLNCGKVKMIKC